MVSRATRTAPIDDRSDPADRARRPGLVAVFSERPVALALPAGTRIGREYLASLGLDDPQMSREHFDVQGDDEVAIVDRDSRNGTFVDGVRVGGRRLLGPGAVVRAGRTLFVAVADVGRFLTAPPTTEEDVVVGPDTADVFARARALGRLGQLLVLGESGTGKEHVARAFHSELGPRAPFIAVNCATIQHGIAERLLFGARKGVYTGADHDADGLVRAADGGTLFLDEVAELDLSVQSKLLRFLETREYFPLGEVRPRTASVRVCFATLGDLRAAVALRRFREDLYHRVATPAVFVPPLHERKAEIPFLVDLQIRRSKSSVRPSAAYMERALLAPWKGNVRQLLRSVEASLVSAELDGRTALVGADVPDEPPSPSEAPAAGAATTGAPAPTDEEVALALKVSGGNVAMAARALGIHRSRLRRWLAKST